MEVTVQDGIFLSGKAEQEASEIPPIWDLAWKSAYKQAWHEFFCQISRRPESLRQLDLL